MVHEDSGPTRVRLSDLRTTVGWPFFVIAFIGRLPVAMNIVGVLTMVALVRGSLAEAGLASAMLGVASGIGGPLLGAAADRWGQRGVLSVAAVANATALAGVVAATYLDVPPAALVAACFIAGATSPQISPLTRARWLALLSHAPGRPGSPAQTAAAMSYEGMADELSFVGGPVLVGVLATVAGAAAPVVVAAALTVVFVIAFAWHPTAAAVRPTPRLARQAHSAGQGRRPSLWHLRVLVPIGGMFCMGAFFGSALASLTEFMRGLGVESQTGLAYGAMGVTSAVCALAMLRVPERVTLASRWLAAALILVGAAIAMSFVGTPWAMVLVLLLAGAAAGPILVTMFSIGAQAAPTRRVATTMTLLSSGITVGQALATALTSTLAERGGFHLATIVVIASALGGTVLALANIVLIRRARARARGTEPPSPAGWHADASLAPSVTETNEGESA